MQIENQVNSLMNLKQFIFKMSQSNILLLIDFLDNVTIYDVVKSLQHYVRYVTNYNNSSYGIVLLYRSLYVKSFLFKWIDFENSSNIYDVYNEQKFKYIEKKKIQTIFIDGYQHCKFTYQKFGELSFKMEKQIKQLDLDGHEFIQNISTNVSIPILPQIRLKKGHIGMYCNSSLQFLLVDKNIKNHMKIFVEQIYVQLNSIILNKKQAQLNQNTYQKLQKYQYQQQIQIIHTVFNQWYWIDSINYKEHLISDYKENKFGKQFSCVKIVHNLIVYLMAWFDNFIQIMDNYLDVFKQDIYHQFLEFTLRFSNFRNTVVQLEKQLSFLFEFYNDFYYDYLYQNNDFQQNSFNRINFWSCILSKWYAVMSKRHSQFNNIYCYLFKKHNFSQLKQNLQNSYSIEQKYSIELDNNLIYEQQQIIYQTQINQNQSSSQILQYLQSSPYFLKQLLLEYTQYLLDLSINQLTVHYCGHSLHNLSQPYKQFQQYFQKQMKEYFNRMFECCSKIKQNKIVFIQVIKKVFEELDKEILKPVSFRKLVNLVNEKYSMEINEPKSPLMKEIQKIIDEDEYLGIQQSEYKEIDLVKINFNEQDKRIEYYNQELKINQITKISNIMIYNTEQNISLKKSSDTNCTRSSIKKKSFQQNIKSITLHKTQSCEIQSQSI